MNILLIPTKELQSDREASWDDACWCEFAISLGVARYGDGLSVKRRRETNLRVVGAIDAELFRRQLADKEGGLA